MYSMCKYLRILDFCQTSWVTTSHATAGFHPKGPFDSCSCSKQQAAGKLRCQHISGVGVNLFCLLLRVVLLHILHGQQGNASSTNLSSNCEVHGKGSTMRYPLSTSPPLPRQLSDFSTHSLQGKIRVHFISDLPELHLLSQSIKNTTGTRVTRVTRDTKKQKTWPAVATICKIYMEPKDYCNWKGKEFFQTSIFFGFHVNFPGCTPCSPRDSIPSTRESHAQIPIDTKIP